MVLLSTLHHNLDPGRHFGKGVGVWVSVLSNTDIGAASSHTACHFQPQTLAQAQAGCQHLNEGEKVRHGNACKLTPSSAEVPTCLQSTTSAASLIQIKANAAESGCKTVWQHLGAHSGSITTN